MMIKPRTLLVAPHSEAVIRVSYHFEKAERIPVLSILDELRGSTNELPESLLHLPAIRILVPHAANGKCACRVMLAGPGVTTRWNQPGRPSLADTKELLPFTPTAVEAHSAVRKSFNIAEIA